jgi:hypothetical protein
MQAFGVPHTHPTRRAALTRCRPTAAAACLHVDVIAAEKLRAGEVVHVAISSTRGALSRQRYGCHMHAKGQPLSAAENRMEIAGEGRDPGATAVSLALSQTAEGDL